MLGRGIPGPIGKVQGWHRSPREAGMFGESWLGRGWIGESKEDSTATAAIV